ncbi:hypothetical protein GS982_01185 [Rhodococcus hoagii]|uniref:Uncharacterized protein n=1 Tax=Rhodococcus hoagii TaxID=43767 RepID=A0A9Q5EWM4_RHOHA|nr:hypothetical protein [Prescottella equi]NKT77221.1 hypothetical protein [Prescottella equi]NKZ81005.1 hypothetical protein [Prescottella equi]
MASKDIYNLDVFVEGMLPDAEQNPRLVLELCGRQLMRVGRERDLLAEILIQLIDIGDETAKAVAEERGITSGDLDALREIIDAARKADGERSSS